MKISKITKVFIAVFIIGLITELLFIFVSPIELFVSLEPLSILLGLSAYVVLVRYLYKNKKNLIWLWTSIYIAASLIIFFYIPILLQNSSFNLSYVTHGLCGEGCAIFAIGVLFLGAIFFVLNLIVHLAILFIRKNK